jgi:hypothetical protein
VRILSELLVCVFMFRVTDTSSQSLRHRAVLPPRAPRRLRRTRAIRTALDEFVVARALSWCRPRVQSRTPAQSCVPPVWSPPSAAACRRNPSSPELAATGSRRIKIQWVGLDLIQVNTGQTTLTLSFCEKAREFLRFTNRTSRGRKFFKIRPFSFCLRP